MTVRPFHDKASGRDLVTIFFDETDETTLPDAATDSAKGHDPVVTHLVLLC